MSNEIEQLITQAAKRQNIPISYLREQIYPELYQALVQLIDHIIKTDEIRKHQERLKRKKVFDKIEQKKVEKEKLKAEIGSDYISSDEDSLDFEDLGLDKEELQQILNERKQAKEDLENPDEREEDQDDSESYNKSKNNIIQDDQTTTLKDKDKGKENLVLIEENEEKDEDNEKDITAEKEKIKKELKQQRDEMGFNPLKFLAEKLKEIHASQS